MKSVADQMRFFGLTCKALIGSWLGKCLATLIYIPIITIWICHDVSIAQTSPVEGRYFAESPRIGIQAELKDKQITFIRFDLWTTEGGKARISSCSSAGGGFSNQVTIDGLGTITGYCTAPFMHGQLSGARNEISVSGQFPNIKFEGVSFWGTVSATLIPESYRNGYEGQKRLGRVDSTRDFFCGLQLPLIANRRRCKRTRLRSRAIPVQADSQSKKSYPLITLFSNKMN